MGKLEDLEEAYSRVETCRAGVVNLVHETLGPLLASNNVPHAGKSRSISVGVTEVETGCLWFAQARNELAEKIRDERAKHPPEEEGDVRGR